MSITLPDADSEESNGNIPGRQVQNSTAGQQVHDIEIESEDEEENAEDEEGDEDEPDDDEAEAIAQRLSAQLWADINRAQADRAHTQNAPETSTTPAEYDGALAQYNAKTLAALTTMKAVLNYADSDPMAHTTLSTSAIPGFEDRNVLDTLKQFVIGGSIARDLAGPLSQILVILARSEVLFTPLPVLPPFLPRAPIKKRKRYVGSNDDAPPKKRHAVSNVQQVLLAQISEAVSVISNALTNNLVPETPFDPSIIASIQLQLNQVFLFAMTSSAVPSSDMSALQEISALIQMLGVLSGVQITPGPLPTSTPWVQPPPDAPLFADIGTAVYPCMLPGCWKTFAKLFSLRQHQRSHAQHRPHKCEQCPATFVRNHDLKRHAKGHDKSAFKCYGCAKVFSRRDALKRHKENVRSRIACRNAEIEEIQVEAETEYPDRREELRTKMWSGSTTGVPVGDDGMEEGELRPDVIAQAQACVTYLHGPLQGCVASSMGTSPVSAVAHQLTSCGRREQATLASVLARASASYIVNLARLPDGQNVEYVQSTAAVPQPSEDGSPSLTTYGLQEDQAKLLEQAIANATAAAQAQAEAEALLEEGGDESDDDEEPEPDDSDSSDEEQ